MRIIAVLVILASAAVIYFSGHEFAPAFELHPQQAAGWGMARMAFEVAGKGSKIILIARDTTAFKNPLAQAQLEAFKQAVKDAGGTILATHLLSTDPLRPLEVPSGDFAEWIRNAPAGSIIVSLMGPPVLTEQQRRKLGAFKTRIVAFCPGAIPDNVDLRPLFEQHLLDGALISRRDAPARPGPGQDPASCLKEFFQTVTASSVAGLYSASGVRL